MKPECEKRLATVNGDAGDHAIDVAASARSGALNGCVECAGATLHRALHSPALPGMRGRDVRENGSRVVASRDERIACCLILRVRPRTLEIAGRKQACRRGWWPERAGTA
jgi:hypothetical protein